MPRALDDYLALLGRNEIWLERTKGIGLLSADDAIALAQSGPSVSSDRRRHGRCMTSGSYPGVDDLLAAERGRRGRGAGVLRELGFPAGGACVRPVLESSRRGLSLTTIQVTPAATAITAATNSTKPKRPSAVASAWLTLPYPRGSEVCHGRRLAGRAACRADR